MENNPDYKQFIIGKDIAVLTIRIDRARMCDVQDRYLHLYMYTRIYMYMNMYECICI
jgi:hypothetical protein